MIFATTPSQTVGPYFSIGLPWPEGPHAVAPGTPDAITITGTVYDGAGAPVPDSLIEIWQADAAGPLRRSARPRRRPPTQAGFRGFARYGQEQGDGRYEILTVKPGRVPALGGGEQAPAHRRLGVRPRNVAPLRDPDLLRRRTRRQRRRRGPRLASPPQRRETLLAEPVPGGYRFDIRLQGPGETVFFAV